MKKVYSSILLAAGLLCSATAVHAQFGFNLRVLTTNEANPHTGTPAGFQHVAILWTPARQVPVLGTGDWGSGSLFFRVPKTLSPTPVQTYNGGAPTASTQVINLRSGGGTGPGSPIGFTTPPPAFPGAIPFPDMIFADLFTGSQSSVTLFDGNAVGIGDDGFMYWNVINANNITNKSYAPGTNYVLLEFDVPSAWQCGTSTPTRTGCMQLVTPSTLPIPVTLLNLGSSLEPYISLTESGLPFNQVSVTQNNQPLPLDLLSFDATKTNDGRVQLDWVTTSETNSAYFDVQRSADGKEFTETVGHMTAAGNSTVKLNYLTYDRTPFNGLNHYRLKMVDKDGKYTYSMVRTVNFGRSTSTSVTVAPNPFAATTQVIITADQDQTVDYIVTDAAGKKVKMGQISVVKGTTAEPLDLNNMSSGIYFLNVVGKSVNGQVKITKQQ